MKLYHESHGCSLAVDIVARELELPLELVWVDMSRKVLPDGSDLHRVNAKGQVPTLEYADGEYLTEGLAIMQYLADQRPESGLNGKAGDVERYRILEWMSFIASDLHKAGFMPLFKKITPEKSRQIALDHIHGRLQWLDDHLADHDYLVGSRFTIADAHCYAIVIWTKRHNIDTAAWPHLEAYMTRIASRPSVRAAVGAQLVQEAHEAAARGL
ncbi:glutathione S-transferase [Enhydrobacter aerosaccus]|uniref:Glutathione S-transferase n=1 Tax=Enhydrobacter aerosaccus TaxID=225324 RepID=A0A1T4TN91_9HYPH|nr:glutathione transferase GstA [Enhydrobacter aerosaccus]SKA41791.1 glutathione S-transferase [Enhydrobacter aerosaccus]